MIMLYFHRIVNSGQSEPAGSEHKAEKGFIIKLPKRETLLVVAAIAIILVFSYQVRIIGFYNPDGTPKWPFLRNVDSYSYFSEVESMLDGSGSYTLGSRLYQHVTVAAYRLFVGQEVTMESLTQFLIWWPAFLISLAAIPAYFLGRYIYDRKAGVLSAFFVVMSPNIASRTLAGDPDSDVFVILMAVLSLALFAIALRKFDASKPLGVKSLLYALLGGLGVALFAITWPGYWFVFFIAAGAIIGKIILTVAQLRLEKKPGSEAKAFAKAWFIHFIVFILTFWIFTAPVMGIMSIENPFSQLGISADLFGGGGIKSEEGSFPNVYVSVAELQHGGQAGDVINRAAGVEFGSASTQIDSGLLSLISPFALSVFAVAYLIYSYVRRRDHLDTLLVIGLWMIGMVYSSVSAVRFGIFLAPAISVAAAIGLSKLWNITFKRGGGKEHLNYVIAFFGGLLALALYSVSNRAEVAMYTFFALLVVLAVMVYLKKIVSRHVALGIISYFTVFGALVFYAVPTQAISVSTGTILNDNWWAGLNWIRENTESCATIATYWDPGHFIRAIAKRPVVFDGASQNAQIGVPYDGEKRGFEILPLDHGIKQLVRYDEDSLVRARIKDIAAALMTSNETMATEILRDYKGDCSEMYFLASQDLVFKSVWWSYFATWDPTATDPKGVQMQYAFLQQARRTPIQSLGLIGFEYPAGNEQSFILCQNNGTISTCSDSIIGMLKAGNSFVRLSRIIYPVQDGLQIVEDRDGEVGGTVFIPEPEGSYIVYMPEELEGSMFTRMFFFNGLGMEKFELVGNWGGEFKLYRVLFDAQGEV
ncbi:MAG: hypothetical protein HYW25_02115 [Candidatus Aenigmarchaeota archaeon]|nr:hypothetical protein [Candidatus Aenigmarchaeota archaeon]